MFLIGLVLEGGRNQIFCHRILGVTKFEVHLQFFPKYQQGQDVVVQYTWG